MHYGFGIAIYLNPTSAMDGGLLCELLIKVLVGLEAEIGPIFHDC